MGALDGIRVLGLGVLVRAPQAALLLGDMGASVNKPGTLDDWVSVCVETKRLGGAPRRAVSMLNSWGAGLGREFVEFGAWCSAVCGVALSVPARACGAGDAPFAAAGGEPCRSGFCTFP